MAEWLPKSMVLKSDVYDAYVHYEGGEVDAESGSAFDTMSVIEKEGVKEGNNAYVHLRFRYTNKYWSANDKRSIVAVSNKPVEDTSDPTCTLFEPQRSDDGNIQLKHVQSGKYVRRSATVRRLFVDDAPLTPDYTLRVLDSDTIIRVPREVVLKGNNGLYLEGYWYYWFAHGSYPYMRFSAADSSDLNAVGLEVVQQRDGYLRFKPKYFGGKFWRGGGGWVGMDSEDEKGEDRATWWWPIKCGPNTIALKAQSNNRFVKPLTADNKYDTLATTEDFISKDAKMVVEEPVSERSIYDVRYAILEHARVFDEETILVSTETAVNSSHKEISLTLKVAQEVTTTRSFSNSHGITIGAETTIQTGVPFIVKGEIKLSASATTTLAWGTEEQKKSTLEGSCVVTVPPRSKATINCVATSGKCSVPFTYSQRDKRSSDGHYVTSQHVDGIFTCNSYYNVRFEHPQIEPL